MSDKIINYEGVKTLYNDLRARIVGIENAGSGQVIQVDSYISGTSTNPVENRAITEYVEGKYDTLRTYTDNEFAELKDEVEADYATKTSLSKIATTGEYKDLLNKPEFAMEEYVDELHATSITYTDNEIAELRIDVNNNYVLTTDLAPVAKSGSYNDLNNKPNYSNVALTGNYNDLINKPNIPIISSGITPTDNGYVTGSMVYDYIGDGKSDFDPTPSSGYTYLNNGMLLQWVDVTGVTNNSTKTITFPVSFISAPIIAVGFRTTAYGYNAISSGMNNSSVVMNFVSSGDYKIFILGY